MIRFCCEHCGRKIGVQDKYAGKRGKCPECGAVIVIPAKSNVTSFHCSNCNRTINIPKTYAGKEIQCPGCKARFVVPIAHLDRPPDTPSLPAEKKFSTGTLTFLDVPEEYKLKDPSVRPMSEAEKAILNELESEPNSSEEEG